MPGRTRACMAVAATLAVAGCGGDDETRTETVQDRDAVQRLDRFAFAEMKRQSRKTCEAVPRSALVSSLRSVSGDRRAYSGRELTDNDVALLYAEDVKISPIPLQRAAYDGCVEGLKRARR